MARRPKRAEAAAKSQPEVPPADTAGQTSQPIAFRAFDPERVDEEYESAETKVQTAVDHYESAKTVSKRVLEARVCV